MPYLKAFYYDKEKLNVNQFHAIIVSYILSLESPMCCSLICQRVRQRVIIVFASRTGGGGGATKIDVTKICSASPLLCFISVKDLCYGSLCRFEGIVASLHRSSSFVVFLALYPSIGDLQ